MAKQAQVEVEVTGDEWGPEQIVTVYDPALDMNGFVVIDNTALGVGKGGSRMTPTVSVEEVFRLARTMTWKNALAGIPFGGAKSGIVMPGDIDIKTKKAFVQSFARALKPLIHNSYVMGPDVNSGEREMDWFAEALKDRNSATGKSLKKGGLPHELGSTGFGVAHAARVAMNLMGMDIKKTTVAIEGFGNVGSFAFKFLSEMGARIVAIGDSRGTAYKEDGFDFDKIMAIRKQRKSVSEYPGAKPMTRNAIFGLKVDVLIPATVTDVINDKNKRSIKAKLIVEGANIPMSDTIEKELFKKGIMIVPDFVANAGGVISSYAEYKGYKPKRMFSMVKSKVTKAAREVVSRSLKRRQNPRTVAEKLAKEIVSAKMSTRKTTF